MSGPPGDGDFVERVLGEVARQERRLPIVLGALGVSALVLAVPAAVALAVRPALDAAFALTLAAAAEALGAVADNPLFWLGLALTVGWLGWLASLALRGRS